MDKVKAMTLRLSREQAEELEAIAELEGSSITEEIRAAIAAHIETKKRKTKNSKPALGTAKKRISLFSAGSQSDCGVFQVTWPS